MNAKELNFAYRVRHALNENLDYLPASTLDRLASARNIALTRKKADAPARVRIFQHAVAGHVGSFFNEPMSWMGRMGIAAPILVVMIGLVGLYQSEQQDRIQETADIDAAVLSDELPLDAYLDQGFNAYLAKRDD